jgi:hypothetical protein
MFAKLLQRLATAGRRVAQSLRRRLFVAAKPSPAAPLVGTLADLVRNKPALSGAESHAPVHLRIGRHRAYKISITAQKPATNQPAGVNGHGDGARRQLVHSGSWSRLGQSVSIPIPVVTYSPLRHIARSWQNAEG